MSLVCLKDYEERAADILPRKYLRYFHDGAGESTTVKLNSDCYKKLRLLPKCLQDVSEIDTSTNVLGFDLKMPIGISPTAQQQFAHPDGELGNARAAEKAGVIYTLSTFSYFSIEEVAAAAPNAIKWLQVYIYPDRSITENLIRRAEASGFKGVVVTVDSPNFRSSYASLRTYADGFTYQSTNGNFDGPLRHDELLHVFDQSLSWDKDIKWLTGMTTLPVIAKGVLRVQDALKAIEVGCRAVMISNHGGRNLDTTPATVSHKGFKDIISK